MGRIRIVSAGDLREQIEVSLGGYVTHHDVDAIVSKIQALWGTVHIDDIDDESYWEVVKACQI